MSRSGFGPRAAPRDGAATSAAAFGRAQRCRHEPCRVHPSSDPTPSPEDVRITGDAVRAGALLDVEVLDHVIVGGARDRFISLKERGLGFASA